MINNNNLLKFGFKTNSTIGNIPTSKPDYGPTVLESNLIPFLLSQQQGFTSDPWLSTENP